MHFFACNFIATLAIYITNYARYMTNGQADLFMIVENLRIFILTVYSETVMELVLTLLAPWLVPGSHSATLT